MENNTEAQTSEFAGLRLKPLTNPEGERQPIPDASEPRKQSLIVFLDTGLQSRFIPLMVPDAQTTPPPDSPRSLLDAFEKVRDYKENGILSEETLEGLDEIFRVRHISVEDEKLPDWLRFRFGSKTWTLKNGASYSINGIWILIETNTADGKGKGGPSDIFDRGYFYKKEPLTDSEQEVARRNDLEKKPNRGGTSHYIEASEGTIVPLGFDCEWTSRNQDGTAREFHIRFGNLLRFELVVRRPASVPHDVDIVLDLGNTRTSGLFFEHTQNCTFPPNRFASQFQAIRLRPDPTSGEYDSPGTASDGIADSWMVLHELEHQKFLDKNDPKTPKLLQTEWQDVRVEQRLVKKGLFRKQTVFEVEGNVIQRIPQMFMQLSPVLIGEAAKRQFNLNYTRLLVEQGANIQQSSPKRYYWDDVLVNDFWCMILNEWDSHNDGDPSDDATLPHLQGEMLRFIDERGRPLDLSEMLPPHERPSPFPSEPRYPRQSTLTWFLLHVLERADAQVNNGTFAGKVFSPRRIRNVLMTYPSGWTTAEVDLYRRRCQEALDIFSETHVYHGVRNEEMKLKMVPRDRSPDEAVAGQLPFVFSEILRYPGQSANDWISAVGKQRGGRATVRMLNFDIGGGTTDISVIEYMDENQTESSAQNMLVTRLLFKDGQALAGDDLLKRIVEKIILAPLVEQKKDIAVPGSESMLGETIIDKFSNPSHDAKEEAVRQRIVRTCLIPLATFCLSHPGQKSMQFSAMDAGIIETNWKEFNHFLAPDAEEPMIPRDQRCFLFSADDVDALIEETFRSLFRNCALYAAAYDVDLVVFSGKTSEQPYVRKMAERLLPLEGERIVFARSFRPGQWYPFVDSKGYIADAKTVTVVGAALYYALSSGFISGWSIRAEASQAETRNDWGEYAAMSSAKKSVFLPREEDEAETTLLPNSILARRQNRCSTPEAVYKLVSRSGNSPFHPVTIRIGRKTSEGGESLELLSAMIDGEDTDDFELKLWPCADEVGPSFWQETGVFGNIG